MKTFIVSVGTSVITNYKRKFQYKAAFEIDEVVGHLRNAVEKKLLEETSAEIKTLVKAGISPEDNVYLLSTDTKDGKIASNILKTFISGVLNNSNVKELIVEGLQVEDSRKFRDEGIKNLISLIQKIIIDETPSDFYLIISGGFKAVVPYLTIAGMLYDIAVLYIFESTDELIKLPPVPIKFDYALIDSIKELLFRMDSEGYLRLEEFQEFISGRTDKSKIESLMRIEDVKVYPTEILILLWQAYKFKYSI